MLRDAVLLEKDLAGQDVLHEVLLKKLGKNKLPAKAGIDKHIGLESDFR